MLTPLLHRRRKIAKALEGSKAAIESAGEALETTKRIYGTRLLVRGILWFSIHMLSRGILMLNAVEAPWARIAIAMVPIPFFVWWLWTWMKGVSQMDELERRIELEALAFAFPVAVIFFMTLGLLDHAVETAPRDWTIRYEWTIMPLLYYIGLVRAKRRYQ